MTNSTNTHNYQAITADDAFDYAIDAGALSSHSADNNYAEKFMFIGKQNGAFAFKNINTREYLFCR